MQDEISNIIWKDSKRYAWLISATAPLIGAFSLFLYTLTNSDLSFWSVPFMAFIIIPLLDLIFGKDTSNPPENIIPILEQDNYYRLCSYIFVPLMYLVYFMAVPFLASPEISLIGKLGLSISLGLLGGLAIVNGHELGHKTELSDRIMAIFSLVPTFYAHFPIEHNRGHHARVSTPEDPASARFGESFWKFLPRSVIGSIKSGWNLETKRLLKSGKSILSIHNELLVGWSMSIAFYTTLILLFGINVLPWLIISTIIGFTLLELVNYIEHYGLLRQKLPNGLYERCKPEHSWNSNTIFSNVFFYHLQRHSDHHANPMRHYQSLRHFEEAPELPCGYTPMIMLAMFPYFFRKVMDKRVIEHYKGDISKVNLQPN